MLTKERKQRIYLDYAASAPTDPEVVAAMEPYWTEEYGNSGSVHTFGQHAQVAIDRARDQVASMLGCKPREIIFTSGATESDNLVVQGVTNSITPSNSPLSKGENKRPHIVTTAIEHDAILAPCKHLENTGQAEVTYVKPDSNGVISANDISAALQDNTVLVSVMYVNNETGSVQPIKEIGKRIKKLNKEREQNIVFHTDAVQAVQYYNCHVDHTKVDLMSLSAHKIGGPKGIGVLYVREGTTLSPLFYGGSQQRGLRPGTLPTPLIIGCGKAFELVGDFETNSEKIRELKPQLISGLQSQIPEIEINSSEASSPAHISIYFPGVDGTTLMTALDMEGVALSYGAACVTGAQKKSHVLKALGYDDKRIANSLRISLGKNTTKREVDLVITHIASCYAKLRY